VIDEVHAYRGVFGLDVALCLCAVRRSAAKYGARPVFLLASAPWPIGCPGSRLNGVPCRRRQTTRLAARRTDGRAVGTPAVQSWRRERTGGRSVGCRHRGGRTWPGSGGRGRQEPLTCVRSRRGAEWTRWHGNASVRCPTRLPRRIAAYRSGYMAEERRALDGTFRMDKRANCSGVASTESAGKLGVPSPGAGCRGGGRLSRDTWPSSGSQKAGRAGRPDGRRRRHWWCSWPGRTSWNHLPPMVPQPASMLDRPVRGTVARSDNPYVLRRTGVRPRAEMPVTESCLARIR